MGNAIKSLFGGSDDSAQRAQSSANAATQQYIEQQTAQARQDVLGMQPGIDQTRQAGFQQALDVFGQAIPEQQRLYEQGNIQAQQALLSGQPDFANAILGLGTGMNAFAPQSMAPQQSMFQQQIPAIQAPSSQTPTQSPAQILGGNTAAAPFTRQAVGGGQAASPYAVNLESLIYGTRQNPAVRDATFRGSRQWR